MKILKAHAISIHLDKNTYAEITLILELNSRFLKPPTRLTHVSVISIDFLRPIELNSEVFNDAFLYFSRSGRR